KSRSPMALKLKPFPPHLQHFSKNHRRLFEGQRGKPSRMNSFIAIGNYLSDMGGFGADHPVTRAIPAIAQPASSSARPYAPTGPRAPDSTIPRAAWQAPHVRIPAVNSYGSPPERWTSVSNAPSASYATATMRDVSVLFALRWRARAAIVPSTVR